MKVILRLALKNLKEHKSKTAIISFLIILGVTLVILGNAFLETVNRGLEKDFRENYTGDIVITPAMENGEWCHLFGVEGHPWDGHIPQIPSFYDLDSVEQIVNNNKNIKQQTKIVASKVFLMEEGKDANLTDFLDADSLNMTSLPIAFIFAGEESTFYDVFKGINIIDGRYPQEGKEEVMLDLQLKSGYETNYKRNLNVGDKVLILGANTDGILREATVCGFYTPTNKNSAMFQTMYGSASFTRPFSDLTFAANFDDTFEQTLDSNLSSMTEEDLFGDFIDDFFSIEEEDSILVSSDFDYYSILGDTSVRDELNKADDRSWNFIITKLNNPSESDIVIDELNEKFISDGVKAVAIDWKTAATTYTSTVDGINVIFNIMIIILAIVVFFIIMNTMTVSVIERTGEIGTMRAIGSDKAFVRLLFFTESLLVTAVSSIIGSLLAYVIASIVNSLSINIENSMAKVILGGGAIHFTITFKIIGITIAMAILGNMLSNIYPVSAALKVSPLKALSKGSE